MNFVIHAQDRPGSSEIRLANYEAHKAYLAATASTGPVEVLMSGPLVSDDGETTRGSLLIVEAPDRAAVERFQSGDPFARAGVWEHVSISAFVKRTG